MFDASLTPRRSCCYLYVWRHAGRRLFRSPLAWSGGRPSGRALRRSFAAPAKPKETSRLGLRVHRPLIFEPTEVMRRFPVDEAWVGVSGADPQDRLRPKRPSAFLQFPDIRSAYEGLSSRPPVAAIEDGPDIALATDSGHRPPASRGPNQLMLMALAGHLRRALPSRLAPVAFYADYLHVVEIALPRIEAARAATA